LEPGGLGDVEKFYDLTAERTAREWYANQVLMPTQRDLMTLLPKHPAILDFGCGPGYESMRLRSLGAEVTGIDISAESIRIATSRNPDCRFVRMDFFGLDGSLGRFDAVWASGSLIHVPPESMVHVLTSIGSVLSQNGILAATIRDGSGSVVSHPVIDGTTLERIVYRYTREEFTEYCRRSGFRFFRDGALDESLVQPGWRCYFITKA
jgi:2-polyprenyl-3-methyl-5-hydroxy-6-metoxy-1,4-benzoquinol methylase